MPTSETITNQELFDLIDSLGGTPDIIARRLEDEGIKGGCYSTNCPIANFVKRELKLPETTTEIRIHHLVAFILNENYGVAAHCKLPPAAQKFIIANDEGEYPKLQFPL